MATLRKVSARLFAGHFVSIGNGLCHHMSQQTPVLPSIIAPAENPSSAIHFYSKLAVSIHFYKFKICTNSRCPMPFQTPHPPSELTLHALAYPTSKSKNALHFVF